MKYLVICSDHYKIKQEIMDNLDSQKIAYTYPFLYKSCITSLEETISTFKNLATNKIEDNSISTELVPMFKQNTEIQSYFINQQSITNVCQSNPYAAVQLLSQAPTSFILNNNIVGLNTVSTTLQNLKDSNIRNLTLVSYKTDEIRKIVLKEHNKISNKFKEKQKKRKTNAYIIENLIEEEDKIVSDYDFFIRILTNNPDKTLLQISNVPLSKEILNDPVAKKIINMPFIEAYKLNKNLTSYYFFQLVTHLATEYDEDINYYKFPTKKIKLNPIFESNNIIKIQKDLFIDIQYKQNYLNYQNLLIKKSNLKIEKEQQQLAVYTQNREMQISKYIKGNKEAQIDNALLSSLLWLNSINYDDLNKQLKEAIINTVDNYFEQGYESYETGYLNEIDKLTDEMYLLPFGLSLEEFGYDTTYYNAVRLIAYIKIRKLSRQYVFDATEKSALIKQLEDCVISKDKEKQEQYNALAKMYNKKIIAEKLLQKTNKVIEELQKNKFLIKQQMLITKAISKNIELHQIAEEQQQDHKKQLLKIKQQQQLALEYSNQQIKNKYNLDEIDDDNNNKENINKTEQFQDEIDGDISTNKKDLEEEKEINTNKKSKSNQYYSFQENNEQLIELLPENNLSIILKNMNNDAIALQKLKDIFTELKTMIIVLQRTAKNQEFTMQQSLELEINNLVKDIRKNIKPVTILDINTYEQDEEGPIEKIINSNNDIIFQASEEVMSLKEKKLTKEEELIEKQKSFINAEKTKRREEAIKKRREKEQQEYEKIQKINNKANDEDSYNQKKIIDPNEKIEKDYNETPLEDLHDNIQDINNEVKIIDETEKLKENIQVKINNESEKLIEEINKKEENLQENIFSCTSNKFKLINQFNIGIDNLISNQSSKIDIYVNNYQEQLSQDYNNSQQNNNYSDVLVENNYSDVLVEVEKDYDHFRAEFLQQKKIELEQNNNLDKK